PPQVKSYAAATPFFSKPLEKADLILCDDGWRDGSSARIMPEVAENDLIGGDRWRQSSDFAVVSSELDGRRPSVDTLLERLGGSPSPTPSEWANTVEHLAARIGGDEVEATWDDFLASVNALLPRALRLLPGGLSSDALGGAKFLPTADGRLLSASDTARVFFQPRRGFDDAADFVDAVPDSLQDRIAFLHEDVTTHEGPQSQRTDVREFLGRNGRFVQTFRREDLLRETVIPALPELPSSHDTEDAARCAEILAWTLELIRNHEQEMPVDLLKRLPVACHGGWFAAGEAIFGPGWPARHGESVQALADGLPPSVRSLLERALLPPRNPRWGLDADAWGDLFERAGVVDALPTRAAEPFRFPMSKSYSRLPREAPAGIPQSAWNDCSTPAGTRSGQTSREPLTTSLTKSTWPPSFIPWKTSRTRRQERYPN
ncbi:MAG: hypothetical protein OXH70_20015, partial [Acidobacteria bacterium]|nr:hypothetical protein [Acidobacteriota bacterium]